jgi:parvulin-like peptidyl-prolyl isomerase
MGSVIGCGNGAPPSQKTSATQASTVATPAPNPTPTQSAATPTTGASGDAPTRIAAQHVLIGYKGTRVGTATRSKEDARKLAEEVRKKAVDGEDFAKLAQQYSDDPASKERLGSVGTFDREGMVKPFSDAAFALKVGEVSPVVETYFGFHIIKRNQ